MISLSIGIPAAASLTTPLLATLSKWGYAGVALALFLESAGVPVPGETALIAASFGAAHGVLALQWIIVVAFTATVLGDNLGFAIGRRLGRGWAERHGSRVLLTPSRLHRIDAFFDRFGPVAVALARFVPGVRVLGALAAGTSGMRWPVFLRYNVLGAIAWVSIVSFAGFALGRGYAAAGVLMGRAGVVLLVVVPVALLSAWLLIRLRRYLVERRGRHITAELFEPLVTRWLAVIGVSAVGVLTFAAIAEEVAEREASAFDDAIRSFMLAHQTPTLESGFRALTWAGSTLVLGPLATAVAIWAWKSTRRTAAAVTALSPVLAVSLMLVLKLVFHRIRPESIAHITQPGYSFPSGHATASMAIAVTLAYVLVREGKLPPWTIGAAIIFGILVGLSRLYLDVHWATDVAGGWAIGLAVATACIALSEWLALRATARGATSAETTA